MVSFARIELGLIADEAMALTYRAFHFLKKAAERKETRLFRVIEVMVGQNIAMVANTGSRGFKDTRQPVEFMPSEWSKGLSVQEGKRRPRRAVMRQKRLAAERVRSLLMEMSEG